MEAFFHAASDWADSKGVDMIFVRDYKESTEDSCMWAVLRLRDACGPFQAELCQMNMRPARKATKARPATKKSPAVAASPAKPPETIEDFKVRVSKTLTAAVIEARKSRIGNSKLSLVA